MHKSLDEFEFQPDPTTDYSVKCSLAFEKIHVLCENFSTFMFDLIFFILARNKAMYKSLFYFLLNFGIEVEKSSRNSTDDLLFIQISSGVVWQTRDLHL